MAWETGTATDYKNLLLKLKDFLTTNATLVAAGQAWEVLRYDSASAEHELILKGKGLGGSDEIFVGIRTETNAGSDYYNWILYGMTGYSSGAAISGQPGALNFTEGQPKVLLMNATIKYWFVANGRYVHMVAKVSSVYESMFLGFITPYGPPTSYPYPLLVGGSFSQQYANATTYIPRWSDTSLRHSAFPFAVGRWTSSYSGRVALGAQAAFFFGVWMQLRSGYYVNDTDADPLQSLMSYNLPLQDNAPFISPFGEEIQYIGGTRPTIFNSPGAPYGGTYPVFPAVLLMPTPNKNVFGEIPSVFAVPNYGLVAEDIITVDGVSYLVVPNTYRSGVGMYYLLKLEA